MWLGHTRRHRSEKLRVVVRGGAVPLERLKYFGALVDVRRVYTIYACCCYININIVAHYLVVFVEYSVKSTPSLFQIRCMEAISVFHSLRETGNDLS